MELGRQRKLGRQDKLSNARGQKLGAWRKGKCYGIIIIITKIWPSSFSNDQGMTRLEKSQSNLFLLLLLDRENQASHDLLYSNHAATVCCVYNQSYPYQVQYINTWKKILRTVIWADKNGLVSDRLACTSRKTWNVKTFESIRYQF